MFTKELTIREIRIELGKLPTNQQILFAADVVRSVLYIFEYRHPYDNRPRKAIELAESLKYNPEASTNAAYNSYTGAYDNEEEDAAYAAYAACSVASCPHLAVYSAIKAIQTLDFINDL